MPVVESWTCPNCRIWNSTTHCPECGERTLKSADLTLLELLLQAFRSITSVDSRLLRSFRYLVTRPGVLTVAYLEGLRKPYIAPFQMFLIANVAFFTVQSFTGTKIFSTSLASHLHNQDWSEIAQRMVADKLSASHTTLEAYAPLFDQAAALNSKSLVILLGLPLCLLLLPMFYRSGRPFVSHLIFALHFYSFLLLFFCLLLIIVSASVLLGGAGMQSALIDRSLFAAQFLVSMFYIYLAAGVVYGSTGGARILKAAGLAVMAAVAIPIYRFAVFLITINT